MSRFRMESWGPVEPCTCDLTAEVVVHRRHEPKCPFPGTAYEWKPMGQGPWRPRRSPLEAAQKCITWTGMLGIPTMRVVEISTDTVVWLWGADREDHAVPHVLPEWHQLVLEAASAELDQISLGDDYAAPPAPGEPVSAGLSEDTLF